MDLLWGSAGKVPYFDGRQQAVNVVRNFFNPLQVEHVDKVIEQFLPPQTFEHRKDGPAFGLIDMMTSEEKLLFEEKLIKRLDNGDNDIWISEGLAYLKSEKALPALYKLLSKTDSKPSRITIESSIFQICKDPAMIDAALEDGSHVKDKYSLISVFYNLALFRDRRVNDFVRQYFNDPDYLVSYNAKRAIGI
jgi:hypothetical protein